MYGRKFAKSLCHAWGASPIYLLGKYYLGVKPTSPGYETYRVEPNLGGLQWMEGKVPTPNGEIILKVTNTTINIKSPVGIGSLWVKSKSMPLGAVVVTRGKNLYEIALEKGVDYTITYEAL